MQTEVTIPAKVTKSIKPAPKKSEIIEALAIRKHQQLTEEHEENRKRKAELLAKFETLALALPPATDRKADFDWTYRHEEGQASRRVVTQVTIKSTFQPDQLTAEMRTVLKEIMAIDSKPHYVPCLADIRRSIRDRMTGQLSKPSDRVAALLADKAAVTALDRTLKQLDKPAQPQLAA